MSELSLMEAQRDALKQRLEEAEQRERALREVLADLVCIRDMPTRRDRIARGMVDRAWAEARVVLAAHPETEGVA